MSAWHRQDELFLQASLSIAPADLPDTQIPWECAALENAVC